MFVSTYSTYLHTNTTDNIVKNQERKESSSFNIKSLKSTENTTKQLVNTPVNYISESKALKTKAQIQQQEEQNNSVTRFTSINSQMKVSSAYASNSTMFSLMIKHQTPVKQDSANINQNLPQDIKDIKESFLRDEMVNTYVANNNYFQITA